MLAPKERNSAPTQSTASVNWPMGRPKGTPAAWHFSAAERKVSQFQVSAPGPRSAFAGHIARTSSPACCCIRSKRMQGGLVWVPETAGTPRQAPSRLPRYSAAGSIGPYFCTKRPITSSTGSRSRAWAEGSQVGKARMSWPERDCACAAMVSRFWLPTEVMKSLWTSTRFRSPHSLQSSRMMPLPAGTQWSHQPQRSVPPVPWAWTMGAARTPPANTPAPARKAARRPMPEPAIPVPPPVPPRPQWALIMQAGGTRRRAEALPGSGKGERGEWYTWRGVWGRREEQRSSRHM